MAFERADVKAERGFDSDHDRKQNENQASPPPEANLPINKMKLKRAASQYNDPIIRTMSPGTTNFLNSIMERFSPDDDILTINKLIQAMKDQLIKYFDGEIAEGGDTNTERVSAISTVKTEAMVGLANIESLLLKLKENLLDQSEKLKLICLEKNHVYQNKIFSLQTEVKLLRDQLHKAQPIVDTELESPDTEETIRQLKETVAQLREENFRLSHTNASLIEDLDQAASQPQNGDFHHERVKYEDEINELRRKLSANSDQGPILKRSQTMENDPCSEKALLQTRVCELIRENQDLNQVIDTLRQELNEIEDKTKEETDTSHLQAELKKTQEDNRRIHGEISELMLLHNQEMGMRTKEYNALLNQLEDLRAEKTSIEKAAILNSPHFDFIEGSPDTLRKEIADLRIKVSTLSHQNEAMKNGHLQLVRDREEVFLKAKELHEKCEKLKAEQAKLDAEAKKVGEKTSKSWVKLLTILKKDLECLHKKFLVIYPKLNDHPSLKKRLECPKESENLKTELIKLEKLMNDEIRRVQEFIEQTEFQ